MEKGIIFIVAVAIAALVFSLITIIAKLSTFHTMAIAHSIANTGVSVKFNIGWSLAIATISALIIALYFLL